MCGGMNEGMGNRLVEGEPDSCRMLSAHAGAVHIKSCVLTNFEDDSFFTGNVAAEGEFIVSGASLGACTRRARTTCDTGPSRRYWGTATSGFNQAQPSIPGPERVFLSATLVALPDCVQRDPSL